MRIKPTAKRGSVLLELQRDEERLLVPEASGTLGVESFALQTILVPIDFSECSRNAIRYAVPLAQQFGAKLILLEVARFEYAGSETDDLELPLLERKVVDAYRRRLDELAKREIRDAAYQVQVSIGKTVPNIISVAKSAKADLIVISTHGCSGNDSIVGSTTERVVRHAPCPVLVVREREHEFIRQTGGTK
jgi:nucleotide-binding universal stress UspA family protein